MPWPGGPSEANARMRPLRVLIVGTGSRGGIGRYERLLEAALEELATRGDVEWRGVWRRDHPNYLDPRPRLRAANDDSLASLLTAIARACRRWSPDVIYYTHVYLARIAPVLPLLGIHTRYVIGTLGVEVWDRLTWSKRLPLAGASTILAISDYTRSRVISVQGVPEARCKTVHLALEDYWVAAAEALGADDISGRSRRDSATYSLLSVCRLERDARDKGVDWVLHAMALLAPSYPGLRYTVVGDGNDSDHLKGLAEELALQDVVTFTGALTHDDLLAAYAACDLFVLPTRREGFGLVFLEAMAFRKPIVAVASAGTLVVIAPGREGLLIGGEAELPAAIETMMRDPSLAARMGKAGREAVTGRFSFDAFVGRLWEVTLRDHPSGPKRRIWENWRLP
jgi:phosphatidylinositol alpha-1,6-mannosyltransferase